MGGVKYNVWFADELVYAPMVSRRRLCCCCLRVCVQGVFYPDTFSLHHNEQQAAVSSYPTEGHWQNQYISRSYKPCYGTPGTRARSSQEY